MASNPWDQFQKVDDSPEVVNSSTPAADAPAGMDMDTIIGLENTAGYAKRKGIPVHKVVSHAGAIGEMQIMPGTAAQYGFDPAKLYDPEYNRKVGQVIIDDLNKRFNNDREAVAIAYNAGPGRANRWLRKGRNDAVLPAETRGYLSRLRNMPPPAPVNWDQFERAPKDLAGEGMKEPGPERTWSQAASDWLDAAGSVLYNLPSDVGQGVVRGVESLDKTYGALAHDDFQQRVARGDYNPLRPNELDQPAKWSDPSDIYARKGIVGLASAAPTLLGALGLGMAAPEAVAGSVMLPLASKIPQAAGVLGNALGFGAGSMAQSYGDFAANDPETAARRAMIEGGLGAAQGALFGFPSSGGFLTRLAKQIPMQTAGVMGMDPARRLLNDDPARTWEEFYDVAPMEAMMGTAFGALGALGKKPGPPVIPDLTPPEPPRAQPGPSAPYEPPPDANPFAKEDGFPLDEAIAAVNKRYPNGSKRPFNPDDYTREGTLREEQPGSGMFGEAESFLDQFGYPTDQGFRPQRTPRSPIDGYIEPEPIFEGDVPEFDPYQEFDPEYDPIQRGEGTPGPYEPPPNYDDPETMVPERGGWMGPESSPYMAPGFDAPDYPGIEPEYDEIFHGAGTNIPLEPKGGLKNPWDMFARAVDDTPPPDDGDPPDGMGGVGGGSRPTPPTTPPAPSGGAAAPRSSGAPTAQGPSSKRYLERVAEEVAAELGDKRPPVTDTTYPEYANLWRKKEAPDIWDDHYDQRSGEPEFFDEDMLYQQSELRRIRDRMEQLEKQHAPELLKRFKDDGINSLDFYEREMLMAKLQRDLVDMRDDMPDRKKATKEQKAKYKAVEDVYDALATGRDKGGEKYLAQEESENWQKVRVGERERLWRAMEKRVIDDYIAERDRSGGTNELTPEHAKFLFDELNGYQDYTAYDLKVSDVIKLREYMDSLIEKRSGTRYFGRGDDPKRPHYYEGANNLAWALEKLDYHYFAGKPVHKNGYNGLRADLSKVDPDIHVGRLGLFQRELRERQEDLWAARRRQKEDIANAKNTARGYGVARTDDRTSAQKKKDIEKATRESQVYVDEATAAFKFAQQQLDKLYRGEIALPPHNVPFDDLQRVLELRNDINELERETYYVKADKKADLAAHLKEIDRLKAEVESIVPFETLPETKPDERKFQPKAAEPEPAAEPEQIQELRRDLEDAKLEVDNAQGALEDAMEELEYRDAWDMKPGKKRDALINKLEKQLNPYRKAVQDARDQVQRITDKILQAKGEKPLEVQKDEVKALPEEIAKVEQTRNPIAGWGASKKAEAKTPSNIRVPVMYTTVSLDDLIASHSVDGKENPEFPQALQPRDRTNKNTTLQLREIISKWNPPELLESPLAGTGAPIIDEYGIVEAGNGRVMALREVRANHPELWQKYQDALRQAGYGTSSRPDQVLVRVRTNKMSPQDRAAFARDSNAAIAAEMTAAEKVRADARSLADDVFTSYVPGPLSSAANRPFVTSVLRAITTSPAELATMVREDGLLNDVGMQRVRQAMLGKAYPEDKALIEAMVESKDDIEVKAIAGALMDVAPQWAAMRADARMGRIPADMDATKPLLEAVSKLVRARREGVPITKILNDNDLFAGLVDDRTKVWASYLFKDTALTKPKAQGRLKDDLEFYTQEARKQTIDPSQGDLIGGGRKNEDQLKIIAKRLGVEPADVGAGKADTGAQLDLYRAKPEVARPGSEDGAPVEPAEAGSGAAEAEPDGEEPAGLSPPKFEGQEKWRQVKYSDAAAALAEFGPIEVNDAAGNMVTLDAPRFLYRNGDLEVAEYSTGPGFDDPHYFVVRDARTKETTLPFSDLDDAQAEAELWSREGEVEPLDPQDYRDELQEIPERLATLQKNIDNYNTQIADAQQKLKRAKAGNVKTALNNNIESWAKIRDGYIDDLNDLMNRKADLEKIVNGAEARQKSGNMYTEQPGGRDAGKLGGEWAEQRLPVYRSFPQRGEGGNAAPGKPSVWYKYDDRLVSIKRNGDFVLEQYERTGKQQVGGPKAKWEPMEPSTFYVLTDEKTFGRVRTETLDEALEIAENVDAGVEFIPESVGANRSEKSRTNIALINAEETLRSMDSNLKAWQDKLKAAKSDAKKKEAQKWVKHWSDLKDRAAADVEIFKKRYDELGGADLPEAPEDSDLAIGTFKVGTKKPGEDYALVELGLMTRPEMEVWKVATARKRQGWRITPEQDAVIKKVDRINSKLWRDAQSKKKLSEMAKVYNARTEARLRGLKPLETPEHLAKKQENIRKRIEEVAQKRRSKATSWMVEKGFMTQKQYDLAKQAWRKKYHNEKLTPAEEAAASLYRKVNQRGPSGTIEAQREKWRQYGRDRYARKKAALELAQKAEEEAFERKYKLPQAERERLREYWRKKSRERYARENAGKPKTGGVFNTEDPRFKLPLAERLLIRNRDRARRGLPPITPGELRTEEVFIAADRGPTIESKMVPPGSFAETRWDADLAAANPAGFRGRHFLQWPGPDQLKADKAYEAMKSKPDGRVAWDRRAVPRRARNRQYWVDEDGVEMVREEHVVGELASRDQPYRLQELQVFTKKVDGNSSSELVKATWRSSLMYRVADPSGRMISDRIFRKVKNAETYANEVMLGRQKLVPEQSLFLKSLDTQNPRIKGPKAYGVDQLPESGFDYSILPEDTGANRFGDENKAEFMRMYEDFYSSLKDPNWRERFKPPTLPEFEHLVKQIREEFNRIAPSGYTLRPGEGWMRGNKLVLGFHDPNWKIIAYSVNVPDPYGTFRHEVFHAVWDRLSEPEKRAIYKAALENGSQAMNRWDIHKRYGHLNLDARVQEFGAEEFMAYRRDAKEVAKGGPNIVKASKLPPILQKAFDRISKSFDRLGNYVRDLFGIKDPDVQLTADDVYQLIESGIVGKRPLVTDPTKPTDNEILRSLGPKVLDDVNDTLKGMGLPLLRTFPVKAQIQLQVGPAVQAANGWGAYGSLREKLHWYDLSRMGKADYWRIKTQDKELRLRRIGEMVEQARGRVLATDEDLSLAATTYHSVVGNKLSQFDKRIVKELVDVVAKQGLRLDQLNDYIQARAAPDRNKRMAEINPPKYDKDGNITHPGMPDGGSGMTNAEARAIIEKERKAGNIDKLNKAAEVLYKVQDETRQILLDSGLVPKEILDQWDATEPYHVPFRGFSRARDIFGEDPEHVRAGSGFDVRGSGLKRALGRAGNRAGDSISYILAEHEQAIIRGEKNKVTISLGQFIHNNMDLLGLEMKESADGSSRRLQAKVGPDGRTQDVLFEIDALPIKRTLVTKYREEVDPATGQTVKIPYQEVAWRHDPLERMRDENTVGYTQNGVVHYIKMNDALFARAMKNLSATHMNEFVRGVASLQNLLGRLMTQYNPTFSVPNLLRDSFSMPLNLLGMKGIPKGVAMTALRRVPQALIEGYRATRFGKKDTPMQRYAHEMLEHGGRIEYFGLEDVETLGRRLQREMGMADPTTLNGVRRLARSFGNLVSDINGAIENATRLAVYSAMRDAGQNPKQSARVALEATVNFYRKGEWGPYINAAYLFANANIQGNVAMLRALHKSPKARAIVLGGIVLGLMVDQWNSLISPENEIGQKRWDAEMTDWTKDHNVTIMNPDGESNMTALKIPLPYGYHIFHAMGQRIGQMLRGVEGKTPLNVALTTMASSLDAFLPIGQGSQTFESVPGFVRAASPTLMQPFVDVAVNMDFTGRPIQKPKTEYNQPIPESQRAFNNVGPVAKWVTQELNKLTGGSELRSGWMDLSPAMIDHIFGFYTGGLGRFIQQAVQLPMRVGDESFIEPRSWPIVNRFIEGKNQWYLNQKFFAVRDALEITKDEINSLRMNPDPALRQRLLTDYMAEIKSVQIFNAAESAMAPLYKARAAVMASNRPDKEQLKDKIEERIRLIQTRALAFYTQQLKAQ